MEKGNFYEKKRIAVVGADMIIHTFEYVRDFEGVIPGTEPKDCGNCLDHNLDMAKYVSRRYLEVLYHIDGFPESRLVYPEQ